MTRRERLLATLAGKSVDRPAVNFYEIDCFMQRPDDPDPFNVFSDPSWRPLLELAWERSDIIYRERVRRDEEPDRFLGIPTTTVISAGPAGSRVTTRSIEVAGRSLREVVRRDRDIATDWVTDHLLQSPEDLEALLELPEPTPAGPPFVDHFREAERRLGDRGIGMIDTSDPLGLIAQLFSMEDYLVVALVASNLFRRALDRAARFLYPRVEAIARALPGRLWRIYGPEYAVAPYLPPKLFAEYGIAYDIPIIRVIQGSGGRARLHCHGRIRGVLDEIASSGCDGLDPIEPPPQGDVELDEARRRCGEQMVLFGNLEVSDIETLPTEAFKRKVERALHEGTAGKGRGFVLMPSSAPYGRKLPDLTFRNYVAMVEAVERF